MTPQTCWAVFDISAPGIPGSGHVLGLFWERKDAEAVLDANALPDHDLRLVEVLAPPWLPVAVIELRDDPERN